MAPLTVSREQILAYRVAVQQLGRARGGLEDAAILDLGVQDTGPDGARWALAVRGAEITAGGRPAQAGGPASEHHHGPGPLVTLWTLRGAPHVYRRAELPSVLTAVAPFSEADAAKRVYGAAKPLRAAGIGALEALDVTARELAAVVTGPMVKGEVSRRVTERLPEPYLRWCGPCGATHPYEQIFRLGATRAGLEPEPGTSPPVLRPAVGTSGRRGVPAADPPPGSDVVRAAVHLLGPTNPRLVAGFLDAPVKDVAARWPRDVADVEIAGGRRSVLEDDVPALTAAAPGAVRLLGPYDLYLQAKDRDLLVPDPLRAKELWPVLGRPGAVVRGGEVIGCWRPRASGRKLTVTVRTWGRSTKRDVAAIEEEAHRLARFRGVTLAGAEVEKGS